MANPVHEQLGQILSILTHPLNAEEQRAENLLEQAQTRQLSRLEEEFLLHTLWGHVPRENRLIHELMDQGELENYLFSGQR